MRGRKVDLCQDIGMLENIGQIQWEDLKFVVLSFDLLHICEGGYTPQHWNAWEYQSKSSGNIFVCQVRFWLIASMWGRSEDLCHNIGMLENIGQMQWAYF